VYFQESNKIESGVWICKRKEKMDDYFDEVIQRTIKSGQIYDRAKKMGGSSELKRMFSFDSPKPEIELYEIIELTNELKRIRKDYESCVYIHLCESSTYYVGYSSSSSGSVLYPDEVTKSEMSMLSRLSSHRKNGGSTNMTYHFPVVSCLSYFPGDKEDEDLMTILMSKFAGNRVRGGKWASAFVKPDYPDMTIEDIKNRLMTRLPC